MATTSLGVALLDFVAMVKWPVHDTPGIVGKMLILAVAAAQLVPVVGYGGIALALRSSPDDRGSKIALWIWTAVALPILLIGLLVGLSVFDR
jgi:hypothetical protein